MTVNDSKNINNFSIFIDTNLCFYGILLNNSPKNAPFELFNGQVIDMFFIDIWEGYLPSYIPFLGDTFISLWPVFNVADSLIFIGVFILIIFQKKFFNSNEY